jgi:hypothetical protein
MSPADARVRSICASPGPLAFYQLLPLVLPLRDDRLAAVLRRREALRVVPPPLLRLPPRFLLALLVVVFLPIPELLDELRLLAMATPSKKVDRAAAPAYNCCAVARASGIFR